MPEPGKDKPTEPDEPTQPAEPASDQPEAKPEDQPDTPASESKPEASPDADAEQAEESATPEADDAAATEPDAEPATDAKPEPLKPSAETKPAPDKKGKKRKKKDRPEPTTFGGKLWHNWVKPIGLVVIVVVLFRSTLLDWNDVPTGSMEPEIQVGDRIAVNRLSYAFQFPLTGPTIGIPFTPIQFKNPLDGIPQIQWSTPERGDIVTFWNPVTNVRMVKRIVAKPGDTISMSGGKLTIKHADGTATASYTDLTTDPPRQTKYAEQGPFGKPRYVFEDLEDQKETILGQTRTIQHIKKRWLMDAQIVEFPDGSRKIVDRGYLTNGFERGAPFDQFLRNNNNPPYLVLATVKDGVTQLGDEPVSYNQFAEALLKNYTVGPVADLLKDHSLGIDGHDLTIDSKPVSFEVFDKALKKAASKMSDAERQMLSRFVTTLGILRQVIMTNSGPITLDDREYFMVGDNRNNSQDSRYFGPVDQGEITGKAFAVAFSFKDNKMFAIPPIPNWARWFKDLD